MGLFTVLYGSILSLRTLSGNARNAFLGDFIDLSLPKEHESMVAGFASKLGMEAPR
jgi:hypothetical protein